MIDTLYVRRHEKRLDIESPQWDEDHYDDWARSDIVWRVVIMQRIGRYWYLHTQFWRDVALPVACFVSLCIGLALGAAL